MTVRRFTAPLGVAVPEALAADLLAKLHYVSEALEDFAWAGPARDAVDFTLAAGHEGEAGRVAEHMADAARRMCAAFRDFTPRVLVDRLAAAPGAPAGYAEDPHPVLEARGALWRAGPGRYGLGPLLEGLVAYFDAALLALAARFEAPRHQFPSLIGAEVLERARYLRSFPHSLNVVAHLREDLEAIQGFARGARWTPGGLEVPGGSLAPPRVLLSPSVCFHWYAWLAGQVLEGPRAVTAVGKCFRYESGNLTGLERLWDFTMREVVFAGPRAWVLAQRQRAMDATVELMDGWGLRYDIRSATDPFFVDDFAAQSSFQRAFDLKFEVRALLPWRGTTLAVGSFNHHQDFFGKTFAIHSPEGRPLETGCIGFGLERLALAFVAQHGPDPQGWPAAVRAAVGA